ncbi:hypothetical protein D5F01_LYC07962 [Larimichthys crocea]|uniref:Uncharacterized protein n=1 Tax=Larimichthys crocea TaxID=215358 RepID=A0A6G0IMZ0_LARCR|nr:hypothetical protein D5F01_LYC07962 [Larimichthys crocea]
MAAVNFNRGVDIFLGCWRSGPMTNDQLPAGRDHGERPDEMCRHRSGHPVGRLGSGCSFRTEKFYDLAGSGTFILLAHLSRILGGANHVRQKVQTGLVTAWGVRLGTFLFMRILKDGHDRRFNNVRDSPGTFFVYWTIQAMWDYIGWTVWGLGFAAEAVADQQKWLFKSDPDNAGKFIQSGLWAYSRHPNYFGEILQWSGLWLSASSVMQGQQYLSVASPLFVWFLLRYVSGIPILEKQAMKKWGSDPAFQDYVRNTPLLWPKF